jgi:aspartate aminotransferase
MAPYTILVDGISKVFAATGLRLGWVCAPDHLSAQFSAFLGHVGAWAPRPVQVATAGMLADTEAVAAARRRMQLGLERRLDLLHAGMLALRKDGLPVEVVAPSGGLYLSVRFGSPEARGAGGPPWDSTEGIRRYLLEQAGLAAVPFEAFGFEGEAGWFRLSVGSVSESAIGDLLVRLRGVFPPGDSP